VEDDVVALSAREQRLAERDRDPAPSGRQVDVLGAEDVIARPAAEVAAQLDVQARRPAPGRRDAQREAGERLVGGALEAERERAGGVGRQRKTLRAVAPRGLAAQRRRNAARARLARQWSEHTRDQRQE
jgi:hypothetical protein